MKFLISLLTVFSCSLAYAGVQIKPISEVTLDDNILYFNDNYAIKSDLEQTNFSNLYVINTEKLGDLGLQEFGSVVAEQPRNFAIMQLSEDGLRKLSSTLHVKNAVCGSVFKLFGDTANFYQNTPTPIIDTNETLAEVTQLVSGVKADLIESSINDLSSIYSRHHESETGKTVANNLAAKYQTFSQGRNDVEIEIVNHANYTEQPSIIVRIKGETNPEEIIIVGSHIDSINYRGDRSPGSDDNASGTATNLEMFRVLMESGKKFDRTIEFHGYAAEEIGLVGSQRIAKSYVDGGKKVIAMVQHDMNTYKKQGSEDKIWFIVNGTNKALNEDLKKFANNYSGLPSGEGSLFGGTSDHASWTRLGIPAAFPFENPNGHNPHIHTDKDTVENANAFNQAAGFAKMSLGFIAHYAGLN